MEWLEPSSADAPDSLAASVLAEIHADELKLLEIKKKA